MADSNLRPGDSEMQFLASGLRAPENIPALANKKAATYANKLPMLCSLSGIKYKQILHETVQFKKM